MKLLVVDDAVQICCGIRDSIDWKLHGIDTVFAANDGQEGWETFLQHRPEVVIADIRMAGLNGLELSRKILEYSPATRVILLSAYSEFEYAREGLEIGVFAYELKPLKIDRLVERVKEAAAAWMICSRKDDALIRYDDMCRRQSVKDLLSGNETDGIDAQDFLASSFGLNGNKQYLCAVLRAELSGQGAEPVLALLNQYRGACICKDEKEIVILLENMGSRLYQENLVAQLHRVVALSYPDSGTAGISSCMELKDISLMYHQACQALQLCFFTGPGSLNRYTQLDAKKQKYVLPSAAEVFSKSGNGLWDRTSVENRIHELYNSIAAHAAGYTPRKIHTITLEMLRELRLRLMSITGEEEPSLTAAIGDLTGSAPFLWMRDYCELLLNVYADIHERYCGNDPLSDFTIRCKFYIGSHYQENLRVQDVATYFRITPNYFSYLFKKNMGVSFKNYLTRVRIEQANKLLKQGKYSATEIAQMVGFLDYKYFHQVYRKYMNCAPTHQGAENKAQKE